MIKDVVLHILVNRAAGPPVGRNDLECKSFSSLSQREIQIVNEVVKGLTNIEIGKKLFINESTVKSHLRTIARKLGISRMTQNTRLVIAVRYTQYIYYSNTYSSRD